MKADIPFVITRKTLEGWQDDKSIHPSARHVSAALPYTYWYSEAYKAALDRLSAKGYCVWFRDPVWTKIWSNVMMIDIRPWSVVEDSLYFAGDDEGNPYKVHLLLPKQRVTLQGMYVFAPNKP